ncbi:HIT family protein [Patescibacteria group bacterium]|nr:HIT family protein [Patescibacteria group bacterium]
MDDCLFCKIIRSELPSHKIYEDEKVLVILDINPWTRGHCLVFPKKHIRNIFEADTNTLSHLILAAQKISLLVKEKLGAEGINILQNNNRLAGQIVDHIHFHIIPRYKDNSLQISHSTDYQGNDLKEVVKLLTGNR